MTDAVDIFRNAKLHPTPGRKAVLAALREDECHSARDIARRLSDVPTATVYRALLALCAAGLARRIPAADGAVYMLARGEDAPQLLCSRCGKVENINAPEVRRYNTALAKKRGGGALLMVADCRRKQCGG